MSLGAASGLHAQFCFIYPGLTPPNTSRKARRDNALLKGGLIQAAASVLTDH